MILSFLSQSFDLENSYKNGLFKEKVLSGEAYGFVIIPESWGYHSMQNMLSRSSLDHQNSKNSLISIHLDHSNQVVTQYLQKIIMDSTYHTIENLMSACDMRVSVTRSSL